MTFELGLYEIVNTNAKRVGVNFQDYVKHLLIQDSENSLATEYASPELAKSIENSLDEYKSGNYIEFDPFDSAQLRKALPE